MVSIKLHEQRQTGLVSDEGAIWLNVPLQVQLAPDGVWALEGGSVSVVAHVNGLRRTPLETRIGVEDEIATRRHCIVLENDESYDIKVSGLWRDPAGATPGSEFEIEIVLRFKGRAAVPCRLWIKREEDGSLYTSNPLRRENNNNRWIRASVFIFVVALAVFAGWAARAEDTVFSSALFDNIPFGSELKTIITGLVGGIIAIGGIWAGIIKTKPKELPARFVGRWRYPEYYIDESMAFLLNRRFLQFATGVSFAALIICLVLAAWQWPIELPQLPQDASPELAFYSDSHPDSTLDAGTLVLAPELATVRVAYSEAIDLGRPIPVADLVRTGFTAKIVERPVRIRMPASRRIIERGWDVGKWDLRNENRRTRPILRVIRETILGRSNQTRIRLDDSLLWTSDFIPGPPSRTYSEPLTVEEMEVALDSLARLLRIEPLVSRVTWEDPGISISLATQLASMLDENKGIYAEQFQIALIDRLRIARERSSSGSEPVSELLAALALCKVYEAGRRGPFTVQLFRDVRQEYAAFDSLFRADSRRRYRPHMVANTNSVWAYWRFLTALAMRANRPETSDWYDSLHVTIQQTASREAFYMGRYMQAGILSNGWENWAGDDQWEAFFPYVTFHEDLERLRVASVTFFQEAGREEGEGTFSILLSSILRQAESSGGGTKDFICGLCRFAESECIDICRD